MVKLHRGAQVVTAFPAFLVASALQMTLSCTWEQSIPFRQAACCSLALSEGQTRCQRPCCWGGCDTNELLRLVGLFTRVSAEQDQHCTGATMLAAQTLSLQGAGQQGACPACREAWTSCQRSW